MFYSSFLQSVERWPSAPAVEIQRQPGASIPAPREAEDESPYPSQGRVNTSLSSQSPLSSIATTAGGARCAILAFNSPAWVATYLGIIASGNTAVPLDTAFTAAQVAKLLDDSG